MNRTNLIHVTFFPHLINLHLIKSVGMIPYTLKKNFKFNSYIICFKNGEYPYLRDEVKGLKLIFLKKGIFMNLFNYFNNSIIKKYINNFFYSLAIILDNFGLLFYVFRITDVLQMHQLSQLNFPISFMYKRINKKGILHVKLDWILNKLPKKGEKPLNFQRWDNSIKILNCDIITTEEKYSKKYFEKLFSHIEKNEKIFYYMPNGFDFSQQHEVIKFQDKKNVILHVGRIGTEQKASEIIIEAFLNINKNFPNWKIGLIGRIPEEFKLYLDLKTKSNSLFKEQLFITGNIDSRAELFSYYNNSKILAIPSRGESFGFVTLEAQAFGNIILGSNIMANMALTNNGKYGYLCPVDDIECFSQKLKYMITNEEELIEKSKKVINFVNEHYNWNTICEQLKNIIKEKIERRNI